MDFSKVKEGCVLFCRGIFWRRWMILYRLINNYVDFCDSIFDFLVDEVFV